MYLSMVAILYVAYVRPYTERKTNNSEIFNESCGFLVMYNLMWLAVSTEREDSQLKQIGRVYIGSVSLNIVVNLAKVFYHLIT